MAIDISTAMIAITIISSISVKPKRRRPPEAAAMRLSPLRIGCSISRLVHALGVNVEYILAAPGLRLRVIARAAHAPLAGIGHGVFGNAAQIMNLLVHRTHGLHAFHQLVQRFGIVVAIQLRRTDLALVHVVLEFVDRGVYLAQRKQQIAFLIAPDLIARQRNRHRRQQHQNRKSDDQLHQGQAALPFPSHNSYCTVTPTDGAVTVMGCCFEFFRFTSVTVMVAEPFPTATNVNCAMMPVPFAPAAPVIRLMSMEASPASLRMSKLGGFADWPSRNPPGVT